MTPRRRCGRRTSARRRIARAALDDGRAGVTEVDGAAVPTVRRWRRRYDRSDARRHRRQPGAARRRAAATGSRCGRRRDVEIRRQRVGDHGCRPPTGRRSIVAGTHHVGKPHCVAPRSARSPELRQCRFGGRPIAWRTDVCRIGPLCPGHLDGVTAPASLTRAVIDGPPGVEARDGRARHLGGVVGVSRARRALRRRGPGRRRRPARGRRAARPVPRA